MHEIDQAIAHLFRAVPSTRASRRYQAEVAENAHRQYQALLHSGASEQEAIQAVLATLHRAEAFHTSSPPRRRLLLGVGWCFLVLLLLTVGYLVYYHCSAGFFPLHSLMVPKFIYQSVALPLLFLCGAYLLLLLLSTLPLFSGRPVIRLPWLRRLLVCLSLLFCLLYGFALLATLFWPLPDFPAVLLSRFAVAVLQNSYCFLLPGTALYFGLKQ